MPTIPKHVHAAAERILDTVPALKSRPDADAAREDLTRLLYRYHPECYVASGFQAKATKARFEHVVDSAVQGLADRGWREAQVQEPAS
jgi:hypothetical protein